MAVGDIKVKFRRHYICVNPDPGAGPDTWRVASPQEIGTPASGGGGHGGGPSYDFNAKAPINVDTSLNHSGDVVVETSMDIAQLDSRLD